MGSINPAIDSLLIQYALGVIQGAILPESDRLLLAKELAKNPPRITPRNATDWYHYQSYVLDGQGPVNATTAAGLAVAFAKAGQQIRFEVMKDIVFKSFLVNSPSLLTFSGLIMPTELLSLMMGTSNVPGVVPISALALSLKMGTPNVPQP